MVQNNISIQIIWDISPWWTDCGYPFEADRHLLRLRKERKSAKCRFRSEKRSKSNVLKANVKKVWNFLKDFPEKQFFVQIALFENYTMQEDRNNFKQLRNKN